MKLPEPIVRMHDELTAWRRDFHAHPELGFEETRTSDLVAERLAAFGGIEVHRGLGKTGVIGTLRVGSGSGTVGLRADMDALPIAEENEFGHRSASAGKMHACGHDGHTTMLLGAARHLAQTRSFDGTVHFIFQPAEEGRGGAGAMLADGLFEKFPCDAVFGMHNMPTLEANRFAVRAGPMMAGGAFFDIRITGKGAHAARPEAGIDPVMVASHISIALQTIVARNTPPIESVVVSVTKIAGGDAYNVIPQSALLAGTVRAFSNEMMALAEASMRRIVAGVADAFGAQAEVDFRVLFPPTVNDPAQADFAAQVCTELVGADKVDRNPPLIMGSEDFSLMLQRVPGCFVNLGNQRGDGEFELHHPRYDFNDEILPMGVAFFTRLVETRLSRA